MADNRTFSGGAPPYQCITRCRTMPAIKHPRGGVVVKNTAEHIPEPIVGSCRRALAGLGIALVLIMLAAGPVAASPPGTSSLYDVGTVDRYLACPGSTSFAGYPVSGMATANARVTEAGTTVDVSAVVRHATPNVAYPIWVFELDASGNCLGVPQAGTLTTNGAGFGVGTGSTLVDLGTTQVQVVLNPGPGCLCTNFETPPIAI
jgi:hypothetical protein